MKGTSHGILIVDDSRTNQALLSGSLDAAGFDLTTVGSGPEALQVLAERRIDLVLLDANMPGLSGHDVLKEIRKTHPAGTLPVIIVSARAHRDDVIEALSLGANDFVSWPVDPGILQARVRTQLARKETEARLGESEQRYALAMWAMRDGLWDWNLSTGAVYYSPRWREMFGTGDVQDGSPADWFDRVHPDDLLTLKQDIDGHLEGGSAYFECECRMKAANQFLWILFRGIAVRDAAGKAVRFAGSATDITSGKMPDALTKLPGRAFFVDRLNRCLAHARQKPDFAFAVLFIDLDGFKNVNDSLGHAAGDKLLAEMARRLDHSVRFSDAVGRMESPRVNAGAHTVARFGGDEFTILLPHLRDISDSVQVAERIRAAVRQPYEIDGHELYVDASIGIAGGSVDYTSAEEILRDADTALYRAKALGKGRYEIFDAKMRERALSRIATESALRAAVGNGQLRVYYQPIVRLDTGALAGFEALIRWLHPERGLLLPAEFVPLAEESPLIVSLGRWVFAEVCRQLAAWRDAHLSLNGLRVAVNLSSREFRQADLTEFVAQTLESQRLNGELLELEITESTAMDGADTVVERLSALRDLGISLSLDDFGTGYSSLAYLHRYPIDRLKVDRSFVATLSESNERRSIVRAILTLAGHIGVDVVAEGVSTQDHREILRSMGCLLGQGHLFSWPLGSELATRLVEARTKSEAGSLSVAG
jgi:EAL domain-containing protein (putative c-di-GMP-specific phosphodiesterase class I)/PleD family two-component response regulator